MPRALAPLLVVTILPLAVAAQEPTAETRTEEWERRRRELFSRLEPYRPGFLERTTLGIEKAERPSILQVNFKGLYPRIQGIASGSRNAAGVRYWQPSVDGSNVSVHGSAFYSLAGYQFYDFQVGRIPHTGKAFPLRSVSGDDVYELGSMSRGQHARFILYGSARHEDYTQLNFFGLGPDSSPEDRTNYRLVGSSFEMVAGYQVGRHFSLTVRPGYLQSSLHPGTRDDLPTAQAVFTEANAPGLTDQPDYWYFTGQAFLDYRDEPGNPHRGGMVAVQYSHFDDRHRRDFRFDRIGLDARGYLPLGSPQRVLAVRAYLAKDDAAPGARVPFYLQEFLGGSHTLRGYDNFRFRGTDLVLLQAEYRWEANPAIELCLFVDAGKVGSDASDLNAASFRTDFGFGLRFKAAWALLMRLDVAWSSEKTRVLLRFSPSF